MVHDINFVLNITKPLFDRIITIMLHDACHDFDNGKTDAPFKEFFLAQDAIPNSANSRLQKIQGFLAPGGGGSSHIGGANVDTTGYTVDMGNTGYTGDTGYTVDMGNTGNTGDKEDMVGDYGLTRTRSQQEQQLMNEHTNIKNEIKATPRSEDDYQRFKKYIGFLLEIKYSFEYYVYANKARETAQAKITNEVSNYFWSVPAAQGYFQYQTDDIDFILGLINNISNNILYSVLIESFVGYFIYVRKEFSKLDVKDKNTGKMKIFDHKYFIEELLRIYTADFTKNFVQNEFLSMIHKYTKRIIQIEGTAISEEKDEMDVGDGTEAEEVEIRSFLYSIEEIIKYEGSEVFEKKFYPKPPPVLADDDLPKPDNTDDFSDLEDFRDLDSVADVMREWEEWDKMYVEGMEEFKKIEDQEEATEQQLANPVADDEAAAVGVFPSSNNSRSTHKQSVKGERRSADVLRASRRTARQDKAKPKRDVLVAAARKAAGTPRQAEDTKEDSEAAAPPAALSQKRDRAWGAEEDPEAEAASQKRTRTLMGAKEGEVRGGAGMWVMEDFNGGALSGGGAPPESVILANFINYKSIIENPWRHLGNLDPDKTDTSFIEDDDGESYKQDPASLESEASQLDPNDSEAIALKAKSKNIREALDKIFTRSGAKQGSANYNMNTFKKAKDYYDQIKKNINTAIKVYFKGAYRRAMGGAYMDTLGGFTILELYDLVIYITLPEGKKAQHKQENEKDNELYVYLSSLYSMVDTWEKAKSTGNVGRVVGSQKNKIAVLNSIVAAVATAAATDPSIQPTDPSIQPTDPSIQPTDPSIQPTPTWNSLGASMKSIGSSKFLKDIINEIKRLEKYNKYCSKIIEFLDGQKLYYGSGDKKLTTAERTRRSAIFTEILRKYEAHFGEEIKESGEWQRLYTSNPRPSGPSLDNSLWKDSKPTPVSFDHIIQQANNLNIKKYINNAIPSICVQKLADHNFQPVCFTSVIDPMGSFGDCYPVPDPNINGDIDVYIKNDENNFMNINLTVAKGGDITLTGSVHIKMDGTDVLDVNDININKFKTKKPLSIANTVKLFKEHDVDHNSKQIVRKFLGDFLQAVEAVSKGLLYLSGDKPATVMYYILNSLYTAQNSIGGFVDKKCGVFTQDDINVLARLGGGGGLKHKKRVRRSRKRRTNRRKKTQRRKTNKRRSNRRNTNKRRTVRGKTTKRRTVRGKTTKRRSVRRKK